MSYGIKAYKSVGIKDDLAVADPHRVIQLLMQGALENMAKCQGAIQRKDFTVKAQSISKSIAIIGALQQSLDMTAGGEISSNLFSLYEFMIGHLADASRDSSVSKIQDVIDILLSIKLAWDQIPVEDREKGYRMRADLDSGMSVRP